MTTAAVGMWGMSCFNSLTHDQQQRLIWHGNLPLGYRTDATGPCRNAAEVEVTTVWDAMPGPRFYCRACAIAYLSDATTSR